MTFESKLALHDIVVSPDGTEHVINGIAFFGDRTNYLLKSEYSNHWTNEETIINPEWKWILPTWVESV